MHPLPGSAVQLAEQQFGVVGRCQLLAWMSRGEVDGFVQRGLLIRLERGVYRLAGSAAVPEQRPMAAAIRARPSARVTGPFVLGLLGVDGFTTRDPFEVLTAPDRRVRNVGFAHRSDPTPADPMAHCQGVPVVSPTVALVDAARFHNVVGDRRFRAGLDAARWSGRTTTERVIARAERLGEHDTGAAFVLRLLGAGDVVPESPPERTMGRLLRRFDPEPEPQVWVTPKRRVDWFCRPCRIALEYLGDVDHGTAAGRRADARRDDELERAGVVAVPVVAADLRDEAGFIAWITHLLGARAYELGVSAPTLARRAS